MSWKWKTRIELNLATALLVISMVCIWSITCYGQLEHLTPDNVEKVAAMPATSLLALITILSLILTAYLIRLLFGRLLQVLDSNVVSSQNVARQLADVARLLAERPCIRNPKND